MSTMLKTAAMTLLSKTLQTFLYKYLSDVDVEGIALPSVYDGSGWGVRLSNVQLREGVQLMKQLPGKLKKTRRRRKKQPKKKKRKKKNAMLKPLDDDLSHRTPTTREGEGEQRQQQQMNGKMSSKTGSPLHHQQEQQKDQIILDESIHVGDLQVERKSSKDYFEEDEAERGRPSTPDQSSKSIFSCFQKGSRASSVAKKNTRNNDGDNDNNEQSNKLPDIPSGIHDNTANSSQHKPPERVESELTLETSFQTSNLHRDSTMDLDLDAEDDAFSKEEIKSSLAFDHDHDHDDDDDEEEEEEEYTDDDDDEEEEFEAYEQPLKLSLGENGRIGILDIRLIGKELHVLVEDAVLTIEAIPIAEEDIAEKDISAEDAAGDNNNINNQNSNVDDDASRISGNGSINNTSTKQSSQQAPKAKEDEKKKSDAKRVTVGDRVLADNPLARAIASIPHLFLRDIRIRLVMRTGDAKQSEAKVENDEDTEPRKNYDGVDVQQNDSDCVLEIGIEFLSVTSGEDVLSHFQQEQDEDSNDEEYSEQSPSVAATRPPPMTSIHSFSSIDNTLDQNEYLVRHIRTGRGPSAGLSVQIFSPIRTTNPWDGKSDFIWARQQWMLATEFYLLRCSGLDVRARIPLGTKKEVANHSWFYGDYQDSDAEIEYDQSTLDSLIFGVDHVAPGPQLPLPPINPHMSRGGTPRATDQEESLDAASEEQDRFPIQNPGESFYTDQNGIQSCQFQSSFHRVARGMIPASPDRCTHLPSQICPRCWNAPHGVKESSELDDSIPLPGLTLQVSMRDPLELNVDRDSLNTVGRFISLFKKKQSQSESEAEVDSDEKEGEESSNAGQEATAQTEDSATETTASTSYFGSILGNSRTKNKEPEQENQILSDAFAQYMQPENIQVLGVYLSEIKIRLHVMSEVSSDGGMSFCYWDLMTKCNTIDLQMLKTQEKNFRDARLDMGYLSWYEYRGVGRNEILSLGTPFPERRRTSSNASYVSLATVATVKETEEQSRMAWPSTASVLMAIPPPLETIIYKSRERHGIQMRFVSVSNNSIPTGELNPLVRSFVNLRLGVMSLSAPWGFWRKFGIVRKEAIKCIRAPKDAESEENFNVQSKFKGAVNSAIATNKLAASGSRPKPGATAESENSDGGKKEVKEKLTETSTPTKQKPASKSLMKYKIQLDGGSMVLDPVLHTKMPLTSFCGERSTDSGIFIESIFQKLEFAYGGKNTIPTGKLDIGQLAGLPENVRMRILLFLDDLGPLEEAFHVKKESNSFKRCRAVNKGILKLAKKVRKARQRSLRGSIHAAGSSIGGGGTRSGITSIGNNKNSSRRQEIMNEFMKMSDVELEELWSLKQKNKKKLAKANSKRASFKT